MPERKPKPIPPQKSKTKQRAKQKPTVSFNHAMVYVRDVASALHFYHDLLGLKTVDVFQYGSHPVYARLQSLSGS
jgi:predicted enzyme related to lactoylglutathione lyase